MKINRLSNFTPKYGARIPMGFGSPRFTTSGEYTLKKYISNQRLIWNSKKRKWNLYDLRRDGYVLSTIAPIDKFKDFVDGIPMMLLGKPDHLPVSLLTFDRHFRVFCEGSSDMYEDGVWYPTGKDEFYFNGWIHFEYLHKLLDYYGVTMADTFNE